MSCSARVLGIVVFIAVLTPFANGQCRMSQLILQSADLPMYPALAHQASVQGEVVLSFDVVGPGGSSPTNIRVVSGNPLFIETAKKELSMWRLILTGPDRMKERNCLTTFRYSLSDKRVYGAKDMEVHFHGLSAVDLKTDRHQGEEYGAPLAH